MTDDTTHDAALTDGAETALIHGSERFTATPTAVETPRGSGIPDDIELHDHAAVEGGGNWSEGDPVDDGSGLPADPDDEEDDGEQDPPDPDFAPEDDTAEEQA